MKILQPIYTKDGDFWRVSWRVIGETPDYLIGKEAIEWAKANGFKAPVLEF